MLYVFGSVLLFSINNVLWSFYAPKQPLYSIMKQCSGFTSLFTGLLLLGVLVYTQEVFPTKDIITLALISGIGFIGLSSLVLGFKKGSLLQYAI